MTRGDNWVLLRGLMRDGRHWGDFPRRFAAVVAGARVALLDLPGNGSRYTETSPALVETMTEFCRGELRRRGITPPYHLLALSLGGMVAADWAHRHSDELAACVLINTSMRPFSPPHWRLRPPAWPAMVRLALGAPDERTVESRILALTSARPSDHQAMLDQWAAWRAAAPVSAHNTLRQLLAAARFRAPLTPPEVRVLVLNSAGDRLVDPRCSQRIARAWRCALATHPDAGHDLPLDDGAWVVRAVRDWL